MEGCPKCHCLSTKHPLTRCLINMDKSHMLAHVMHALATKEPYVVEIVAERILERILTISVSC
jgi:hypothetical protein